MDTITGQFDFLGVIDAQVSPNPLDPVYHLRIPATHRPATAINRDEQVMIFERLDSKIVRGPPRFDTTAAGRRFHEPILSSNSFQIARRSHLNHWYLRQVPPTEAVDLRFEFDDLC